MTAYLRAYAAIAAAMLLLDGIWLGLVATRWYQQGLGHLTAEKPWWPAALVFYLLFPAGLLYFSVLAEARNGWWPTLLAAALFGVCCYATYDLSNLATLRDWPLGLSLLDMAWGGLISMAAASAGRWALIGSSQGMA